MKTLRDIEAERIVLLKMSIAFIGCFVVEILFFILAATLSNLFVPVAVIFMLCIIVACFFYSKRMKAFSAAYKEIIIKEALSGIIDNLTYKKESGIEESTIEELGMMSLGNIFESNDYIAGSYNGVGFEQSDVLIQNKTSNGKNTSVTTYFKGRWMIFDFNKSFHCDLQVREKSFAYAHKTGGLFSSKEKMTPVKMENEYFNRNFKVFAVDEQESFYILTPHFCDAVMRLNERVPGDIMLCFSQNRLHVAVNNDSDAFEPDIKKPIDVDEIRKKTADELSVVTSFVDELRLDNTIYKS